MKPLLPSLLVAAAVCAAAPSLAAAPTPAKTRPAPGGEAAAYRQIIWSDLLPPGWDPLRELRAANPAAELDDSPQALLAMRELWDRAPTVPALDGAAVKLPGYVVPLEQAEGGLREFLLVPYFGACIHSPPPPANQIVHVVAAKPLKGVRTMDVIWVSGKLSTRRHDSGMGVSGYGMEAAAFEPYVRPAARPEAKP